MKPIFIQLFISFLSTECNGTLSYIQISISLSLSLLLFLCQSYLSLSLSLFNLPIPLNLPHFFHSQSHIVSNMNIDSINALLHLYNANIHRNVFNILSLSSEFHHFLPMTMSENLFNQGRFFLIQDINPSGKIIDLTFLIRPTSELFRILNEQNLQCSALLANHFGYFQFYFTFGKFWS